MSDSCDAEKLSSDETSVVVLRDRHHTRGIKWLQRD